jgi:hypothetical protein
MQRTLNADMHIRAATAGPEARRLPRYRLALIVGVLCLGLILVLNVPGVAELHRYPSLAMVLSHLAMTLIAVGLSPRFRDWVMRVVALSARQQALCLIGALVGPVFFIGAVLVRAPKYGHGIFTREWGIVEPLQFVLWLTAAWLAFERARCDAPGTAGHRVFRLAGWGCILLAIEEVDYFGIVSVVATAAGLPKGRIGGHHLGGLHDLVNVLGNTSLLLGLLSIGVGAALVLAWSISQGLHRVIAREILSTTALPLAGSVLFMTIAQLADIDHPALAPVLGEFAVVRGIREEPMELLAVICVNASLLAKLAPWARPRPEVNNDR